MQRNYNTNPNGLTRSSSQHSNNNIIISSNNSNNNTGRPSSTNRYQSPNHFYNNNNNNNSSSGNTPINNNNNSNSNLLGSQQRIFQNSHQQQQQYYSNNNTNTSSYSGMMNIQQQQQGQQQQQFVTLDEFLALKRQLERERGAREDAVSQLREQLFELKEARRRERLDAPYDVHGPFGVGAGSGVVGMNNANNINIAPGSPGYHRSYYQSAIGASGSAMDNSILGRLQRIESYQSSHLQKQLEDLEERLRARADDKGKTSAEASRAELKKLAEQLDALNAATNGLKHDISGGRLASIEQKIADVTSVAQRNSSQIEVVNTHRIHDEEAKNRMQQELQNLHDEIRAVESSVEGRVEAANSRTRGVSTVDEAFVANEVDRRLGKAQDDQKTYVQDRIALIETRIQDSNGANRDTLKSLADRVDLHEHRVAALEVRGGQMEAQLAARADDGLRALDERLSGEIKNRSAEHSNILKDLRANIEAKFEDRINCMRDELDTDYSTQIGQLSDRLDDLAAQSHATASQQNALIRSLVDNADSGKDAASRVLDSMEHFIRENMRISSSAASSSSSVNSDNSASVYSSVIEKITMAKQDEGGPVVGDALKILYQFERGQITSLTQMREDLADLRTHIGLTGLGNNNSTNNNNNRSSPNNTKQE